MVTPESVESINSLWKIVNGVPMRCNKSEATHYQTWTGQADFEYTLPESEDLAFELWGKHTVIKLVMI